MSGICDSVPCKERCGICKFPCFGRSGHSFRATAGKGFAELHQCQNNHVWGTTVEMLEYQQAQIKATQREWIEARRRLVSNAGG